MSYTKGPWEKVRALDDFYIKSPKHTVVGLYGVFTEADANLIAAAPDLLAACERSLAILNGEREYDAQQWLVDVIAKAKGGDV